MFVGHYSVAIAAKSAKRDLPLWSLVGAAQLVDIAWSIFIIAGIEDASVDPSLPGSALVLGYMPWTHSLPAALAWSLVATLAAKPLLKLSWPAASVIGAVVFSHWLLDLVVHRPDLAIWPGGPTVGFGLWNYEVAEQAVEIGLLALAAIFWGAARQRRSRPTWPAALFILLLLVVQIIAMVLPAEDVPLQMGGSALAAYLALVAVAFFLDRPARE